MNRTAQGDRRTARTRLALRHALIALMQEKGWDDISVQDICDQADIGRSTFYSHFRGKDELLGASLDDLQRELRKGVTTDDMLGFVGGLVDHVSDERRLFRSVVGRRSSHAVQARFRLMVTRLVKEDLQRASPAGWTRDAATHFIAGGMVEMLAWWLDTRSPPSRDEVVERLRQLGRGVVPGA